MSCSQLEGVYTCTCTCCFLCDLLSDFGFAQYMSPWDEQSVLRGSPLYMAPEMVCRRQYDSRVDLWSVGVILYGKHIFFILMNVESP